MRSVLDAMTELGADPDLTAQACQGVQTAAEAAGVTIPDQLAPTENTSIYRSLQAEMTMATRVVNGSYGAIHLHTAQADQEHASFQVALEHGPLADLVASGAVIAMLNTLSDAAQLFGWTADTEAITSTMGEARALNDAAALLDLRPSVKVFKKLVNQEPNRGSTWPVTTMRIRFTRTRRKRQIWCGVETYSHAARRMSRPVIESVWTRVCESPAACLTPPTRPSRIPLAGRASAAHAVPHPLTSTIRLGARSAQLWF